MTASAVLSLAPMVFAWLWTWRHLATSWQAHPHYEYGWGVPALFLVLVWQNWRGETRPPARAGIAGLIAAAGVMAWVLGEMIRQHDPMWRLADGLLTAGATLLSVAWLQRAGGWPLVRRQGFPLVFAWTAVPWPMPLELATTQQLLHLVASVAMVCISMAGVPAFQRGSVIELADGTLGLEEACSGIQSLQAALMAALFLGEFYRLTPARRAGMLAAACAIAVLGNLLRVLALIASGIRDGVASTASQHDHIGNAATVLIFAAVFLLARLLRQRGAFPSAPSPELRLPSPAAGIAILALLVATVSARSFQSGARESVAGPRWRIDVSQLPEGWRAESFLPSRKERAMLRFTASDTWKFQLPDGRTAWLYRLEWAPGHGMPPLAFSHTPAMCMPWAGWVPARSPRAETLQLASRALPAVVFDFTQGSQRVVAVQVVSAGGEPVAFTAFEPHSENRLRRLASLWRAPRGNLDEELLLYLPVHGATGDGLDTARELLDAVLSR